MTTSVADGWTMTRRNMIHVIRAPEELILYFSLPIMFVLVFGYVFGSGMQVPGGATTGSSCCRGLRDDDALRPRRHCQRRGAGPQPGVVDRFRSMPMARSALMTGRSAADLLRALLEMSTLLVCGLLVGWQWRQGVGKALLAVGLLLLLRIAITWVGIYLALLVRNPDTVGVIVFPAAFPFTAISNVFVSPELMPSVIGTISEWNPLSATVAAIRELFGNPGLGGDSWPAEHALLLAVLWPVLLIAIFAPLAVRRYQRLSR
ncbi:ABC transporter permease [Micromonospora sp. M12]